VYVPAGIPSWNKWCLHELDWYFPSKIIDSSVPTPAPVFEMMSTNTSKCSYFKSGPGLWTLLAATYNRNHIYIYCWCWVLLVIFWHDQPCCNGAFLCVQLLMINGKDLLICAQLPTPSWNPLWPSPILPTANANQYPLICVIVSE
jgi:hypothetical protein